jgi:isopentenyl-diphosphate Delta-isomerase
MTTNNTTDNMQELFIVVDKADKILGYKTRYECHHDKSLIHRIAAVLIFNQDHDVLLQKRSLTKDLGPGRWGTSCAGHVSKGESYETTARRELLEELGIDIPIKPLIKIITHDLEETEMGMIFESNYDGPFKIDPRETAEVRFFTKAELTDLITHHKIDMSPCTVQALKSIKYL